MGVPVVIVVYALKHRQRHLPRLNITSQQIWNR